MLNTFAYLITINDKNNDTHDLKISEGLSRLYKRFKMNLVVLHSLHWLFLVVYIYLEKKHSYVDLILAYGLSIKNICTISGHIFIFKWNLIWLYCLDCYSFHTFIKATHRDPPGKGIRSMSLCRVMFSFAFRSLVPMCESKYGYE